MASVLTVEDEDFLRGALATYLLHQGHDVIAAIAIPAKGEVESASSRVVELLDAAGLSKDIAELSDWIEGEPIAILTAAEMDWVDIPTCASVRSAVG